MSSEVVSSDRRKTLTGKVVSTKMQKTVVVSVLRTVKHPKYQKYVTSRKKYLVHDERGEGRIGDEVLIMETRPLSRMKRWCLREIRSRSESSAT